MLVVWIVLLVLGLAASIAASERALDAAEALGLRTGIPSHIVGLTIVSVGTDLPEIANSIVASAAGRGDLNVGDSTGSAATQITLVLGVLCLLRPLVADRRLVGSAGLLTVAAFAVAAWMMTDLTLSRLEGAVLVLGWVGSTALVYRITASPSAELSAPGPEGRRAPVGAPPDPAEGDGADRPEDGPGIPSLVVRTLVALAVVAFGAVLAVEAFAEATELLGVPDYATSFLVLSLGTSLPELLVDSRAVMTGMGALALGDVLGSSLIDATLSLGIGPLLFPTAVSAGTARATLMVGGVVLATVLLLLRRRTHSRGTGISAIVLYLALFPIVIA